MENPDWFHPSPTRIMAGEGGVKKKMKGWTEGADFALEGGSAARIVGSCKLEVSGVFRSLKKKTFTHLFFCEIEILIEEQK